MTIWFFIFLWYSKYRTYAENFNLLRWMYQKLSPEENWKNLSCTTKFQDFLNFQPYYLEKLNVSPSKNHLAFLNMDMIKNWLILTFQIKILCLRVVPGYLKRVYFDWYFEILLQNVESAKIFKLRIFRILGQFLHLP